MDSTLIALLGVVGVIAALVVVWYARTARTNDGVTDMESRRATNTVTSHSVVESDSVVGTTGDDDSATATGRDAFGPNRNDESSTEDSDGSSLDDLWAESTTRDAGDDSMVTPGALLEAADELDDEEWSDGTDDWTTGGDTPFGTPDEERVVTETDSDTESGISTAVFDTLDEEGDDAPSDTEHTDDLDSLFS